VFDLKTEDRLQAWRDFRDSLETSVTPLEDVARFWAKTPYNSKVLDPYHVKSWPDPWKLVINNRYDLLAITLGICYTLTLTARFKETKCEIYTSVTDKEEPRYMCVIDDKFVLNLHHGAVTTKEHVPPDAILLWNSLNNQK
jgi:hypothetical protein